jgi:hypothetical protein
MSNNMEDRLEIEVPEEGYLYGSIYALYAGRRKI